MSTAAATHAVRLEPARLPVLGFSGQATALRNMATGHSWAPFGWTLVVEPAVAPQVGDYVLIGQRSRPPLVAAVRRIEGETLTIGSDGNGPEQRFELGAVGLATVVALFSPGTWSAADEPDGYAQ